MSVFGKRPYMYMDTVVEGNRRVFHGAPPEVMDWLKRNRWALGLEVRQGETRKVISAADYYRKNSPRGNFGENYGKT